MIIKPEDVVLAEELATSGGVTAHREFPDLSPVEQWSRVASALRTMGYEVRKAEGPDFSAVYRRAEPKIRAMLRKLCPPGTLVTPELIAKVQKEIVHLLVTELRSAGVEEQQANAVAQLFSAAIHITPKA